MPGKISYDSAILATIHEKANTAKNECFFVGFLDGVLANGRIDNTELEPLLAECNAICRLVGDEDAAEIITEASAGYHDTAKELFDLLGQICEIRIEKIDPNCSRSAANRLLGFCAGVNCDGIITTAEAKVLYDQLCSRHDLEGDPRVEALRHVLRDALEDDLIELREAAEIGQLITQLVGDSYADTGIPSSAAIPVIHDLDQIDSNTLDGCNIVVTGGFSFGTRQEVQERLKEFGATVQSAPSGKTDIVVIGTEGSPHYTYKHHGGKLAKALELRGTGPAPLIYIEAQLRDFFRK